jgi:hypothetical protein
MVCGKRCPAHSEKTSEKFWAIKMGGDQETWLKAKVTRGGKY